MASTRALAAVPLPVQANEAEPMASEVDIPWTIALLSDGTRGTAKPRGQVTVVEGERAAAEEPLWEPVAEPILEPVSVDIRLAIDNGGGGKPAAATTPKICPGVVKGRS